MHYVVPVFAIVGWLLFGPHPRVTWKALFLALIWPGVFIVLTVAQGAVTGFYPYPFVNMDLLCFPTVLMNGIGIVMLLTAVGSAHKLIDWLISRPKTRTAQATDRV